MKTDSQFFRGYVECALWASIDDHDQPMDTKCIPAIGFSFTRRSGRILLLLHLTAIVAKCGWINWFDNLIKEDASEIAELLTQATIQVQP